MPEQHVQPPGKLARRRKRTAAAALLLLAGGAAVNVAVAWGCAYFYKPSRGLNAAPALAEPTIADAWPADAPEHWPHPPNHFESAGASWTLNRYFGYRHDLDREANTLSIVESFIIDEWQLGWPSRSLWGQHWGELVVEHNGRTVTTHRNDGHPSFSMWRTGIPVSPGIFYLLLRPVFAGFIINTLFYALLLWLLFATPFTARRMIRRRCGQCEKCAYPIGVSAVCTECGAAVRPLVARSS